MDKEKTPDSAAPAAPAAHGGHLLLSQPLSELHPMALLEPWINFVPQQQRRLGLFICLALAIHASICLFLIVDVAAAQMRHAPHLYVSLDYPRAQAVGSESSDQFWDRITDPRVFLQPRLSPDDLSADLPPLMPSISQDSAAIAQPASPETYREVLPAASPLEQEVAGAMNPPRQAFVFDHTPTPMVHQTTWQWDDALAQRHPSGAANLTSLVSDTNLTPTRLRVAVDENGVVRHVLLEPISDDLSTPVDSATAEQAASAAQKIRFDPTLTPGEQWGRVTIFWNYTPKPREVIVPTPPAPGQ
jgi:hypothetical protein